MSKKAHMRDTIGIVAMKIVSWLRFSLSQSPFFARDLEQNFLPQSFITPRMQGQQVLCLQVANAVHGKRPY